MKKLLILILFCTFTNAQDTLKINGKRYEVLSKVLLYTDTIYTCKNDIHIRISKTKIFIYKKKQYEIHKK